MRAVLLILLLAGCASTADNPNSLSTLLDECTEERRQMIVEAWWRYEFDNHTEVVYPRWRMRARTWAEAECKLGRTVPQFYPPERKR